jgi:hypothetical protein
MVAIGHKISKASGVSYLVDVPTLKNFSALFRSSLKIVKYLVVAKL